MCNVVSTQAISEGIAASAQAAGLYWNMYFDLIDWQLEQLYWKTIVSQDMQDNLMIQLEYRSQNDTQFTYVSTQPTCYFVPFGLPFLVCV